MIERFATCQVSRCVANSVSAGGIQLSPRLTRLSVCRQPIMLWLQLRTDSRPVCCPPGRPCPPYRAVPGESSPPPPPPRLPLLPSATPAGRAASLPLSPDSPQAAGRRRYSSLSGDRPPPPLRHKQSRLKLELYERLQSHHSSSDEDWFEEVDADETEEEEEDGAGSVTGALNGQTGGGGGGIGGGGGGGGTVANGAPPASVAAATAALCPATVTVTPTDLLLKDRVQKAADLTPERTAARTRCGCCRCQCCLV